jgi:nucleoid DNA-binding protein
MSGIIDIAKGASVKPEIVEEIFEEIFTRVKAGDQVRIKGFGTFQAKKYPGRTLTSPTVNGGEPVQFPDSMMLKFRQSHLAKVRLNTKGTAKSAKASAEAPEAAAEEAPKAKKAKPAKTAPASAPAAAPAKPAKAKKAPKPPVDADDDDDDSDPSDN